MMADPLQAVDQGLDARLVAHGRIGIGRAGPGLRRVRTPQAVHMEEPLGLGVIGLEDIIADRPGGGHALLVNQLAEVLLAQAIERTAVDLAVAPDHMVQAGVER